MRIRLNLHENWHARPDSYGVARAGPKDREKGSCLGFLLLYSTLKGISIVPEMPLMTSFASVGFLVERLLT